MTMPKINIQLDFLADLATRPPPARTVEGGSRPALQGWQQPPDKDGGGDGGHRRVADDDHPRLWWHKNAARRPAKPCAAAQP